MKDIIETCSYLLNNYPSAQSTKDYLNSRLSEDSQATFNFGYFPDYKNISALTSLVDENLLLDNKLFYNKIIEDSYSPRKIKVSFFENYPLILPFKDTYRKYSFDCSVGHYYLIKKDKREKYQNIKILYFQNGNYLFRTV